MTFNGNFFDGKSSKTYPAKITPSSSGWKIVYSDEAIANRNVFWNINDIKKSEAYTKGLIAFSYGKKFPFQKIESTDTNFINFIQNSDFKNLNNKVDNWLHKSGVKSIALLLSIIVGFTILMYVYVIPNVAVGFATNLPNQRVKDFGNYVFKILSKDLEIDTSQTKKLQNFVDAMELDNQFPLEVFVAKKEQLNAFAVSGGKFVIFTGLLEKIKTEHQLAALIGHEVSHIENRHVIKNVARSLSGAIFISVLLGDVSGATAILGENAHQFIELSYSRSLEKEADTFGLKIMSENNLDQHGMPQLFQILKDETKIDVPSFLSSHPMLSDRIEYTKKIANQQKEFSENIILKEKWEAIAIDFSSKNIEETEKNNEDE